MATDPHGSVLEAVADLVGTEGAYIGGVHDQWCGWRHEEPEKVYDLARRIVALVERALADALPALDAPSMPAMQAAPTTQAMRRKAWPKSGSLRLQIVRLVAAAGTHGFTDDDLEQRTGRAHQSVSACRFGLVADGWLEPAKHDNGTRVTRRTRYDNPAQVWVVTPAALRRLATP